MVGIATFGPGDPGSNPGWFGVPNSNKKIVFSQIIQAFSILASTMTLQLGASLSVSINRYLSCSIDELAHQYEELVYSNCQDLCSDSSKRMSSYLLRNLQDGGRPSTYSKCSALLFIMLAHYLVVWKYVSRNIIYLRSIQLGWQCLKKL